jgi:hypothetical protein
MFGAFKRSIGGFLAVSLLASSAASAATSPAPRIDPLVALSVFGTAQSRAAVCGAGSQAAAQAGTSAIQAGAGPTDCVLPVMDAAAPAIEPAPPASVPVAPPASGGIGALPLLAGLAAIVILAAVVIQHDDDDGEINLPIST